MSVTVFHELTRLRQLSLRNVNQTIQERPLLRVEPRSCVSVAKRGLNRTKVSRDAACSYHVSAVAGRFMELTLKPSSQASVHTSFNTPIAVRRRALPVFGDLLDLTKVTSVVFQASVDVAVTSRVLLVSDRSVFVAAPKVVVGRVTLLAHRAQAESRISRY
jgi:hypothetical protein